MEESFEIDTRMKGWVLDGLDGGWVLDGGWEHDFQSLMIYKVYVIDEVVKTSLETFNCLFFGQSI